MTHQHIITIKGEVPEDEAERAGIHSEKVRAAKQALLDVLAEAGHPHTMEPSKIVKTRAPGAEPRKRKPKLVA